MQAAMPAILYYSSINVFSVHIIKAYKGSRGKVPLIHNLGTRWRRVNLKPFYPRERFPVLIVQKAGWVPEPIWALL
jgi:hypothetical protein